MNTNDPHAYLKRLGLMGGGGDAGRVAVKHHTRAMPSPAVSDKAHEHMVPHRDARGAEPFGVSANRGRSSASYNAPGKTGAKSVGHQGRSYQDPGFTKGQGQAGTRSPNKLSGVVPSGPLGGTGGRSATDAAHEHRTRLHPPALGRVKGGGGPSYNKPGRTGAKSVARQGKTYDEGRFPGAGRASKLPFEHLGHMKDKGPITEGHNVAKTFAGKSMKPGGGGRFAKMVSGLKGKVDNPAAVAAAAGRKKYGAKKFAAMGAAGRKRASGY